MMSLEIKIICADCGTTVKNAGNRSRKYCSECARIRRNEITNRANRRRAMIREYGRTKTNLFKSWVMWGEK